MILLFVIARLIDLVAVGERRRLIGNRGGRGDHGRRAVKRRVHGGRVHKRFEDGAGRTLGERVVQLARSVVSSADQRLDFAGARVHGDERHLRLRAGRDGGFKLILPDFGLVGAHLRDLIVHQLHADFHRLRGRALQSGIERRVDAVDLALAQFADDGVANHVHEVRCIAGLNVRRGQFQRGCFGFIGLLARDGAGLDHGLDHGIAPFQGALGMTIGRKIAGRLDQSGQQRGFRHGDVFQIFVEIGPRPFGQARDGEGAALSQIDAVGVELENLLLGKLLLQLHRDQHFDQLALEGFLRAQKECPRELHRDRRTTLLMALMGEVDPGGFDQPQEIDSAVLEEAAVFDRRNRFHHDLGNVVVLHQLPLGALLRVEQRS